MGKHSCGVGRYGKSIVVFGVRWHVNRHGYYIGRRGVLLHREIYNRLHGVKLTRHQLLHHIDGNRTNNSPENLQLVSAMDHKHLHGAHRWTESEKQRLSRQRTEYWKTNPVRRSCVCRQCGSTFETIATHAYYCSRRCARRYYWINRGN